MANIRTTLTAQKVIESGGTKSVSQAMVESGYPKTSAHNPQKLTESKGWKELMDKYLPDSKLLDTHAKLLDSKRDEIRLQATGLGYKVKGKLQENVTQVNVGEMKVEFKEKEKDDL